MEESYKAWQKLGATEDAKGTPRDGPSIAELMQCSRRLSLGLSEVEMHPGRAVEACLLPRALLEEARNMRRKLTSCFTARSTWRSLDGIMKDALQQEALRAT